MTTTIDAAVCNYRTPWDLRAFLESWEQHAPAGARLTVANVDPTDADVDAALAVTGVRQLVFDSNVGYGHAINAALADGDGEVVAAFNADIVLRAGTLDACAGALVARPDWAILGPRQVDQEGRLTHAGIFGTTRLAEHRAWRRFDADTFHDVRDDAVMVSGSALFARRAVWQQLADCPLYRELWPDASGPLLESELFYEDTWLCRHALAHDDRRVVFWGPDELVHKWHQSVTANRVNTQPLMQRSRDAFRRSCDHHGLDHE